ncbi:MAG: hypothetical protein PHE78_00495 [Candidatus Gastranaerophilales bacterium]|nr:hypothetical protein [Candidatus Gastranaerophilales bacterium]
MNENYNQTAESNLSLQHRLLIPPVFYKNRIYYISNPKLFFALYKIGKLQDFMLFAEVCGYDETKNWLKHNSLLDENFLDNVSLYSVICKIKHSCRMRFYAKNPVGKTTKYDLN